jgi:hypothetical protein
LQGLPGKCPHCQSKFRIPVIGEDEPTDSVLTSPIDDSVKGSHLARIGSLEELSTLKMAPVGEKGALSSPALSKPSPAANRPSHAMAGLFAALWQARSPSAQVQLHLSDGQQIAPHMWSERRSNGEVGVFAVRNNGGDYSIHAVAWAHVQRVTLSGARNPPPELFAE